MIIRVKGGKGGIVDYLEKGRKSDRELSRDELDQRVPLSGEIQQLSGVLGCFNPQDSAQKYLHITLSFKEAFVEEEDLQAIDREFREFIFSACAEDEFYYYSEAHLPKIKYELDKKGIEHQRFPHIHVVIPEYNIATGKRENPLGKITLIHPYLTAFQEHINERFDLQSPKDNRRQLTSGAEEVINRYKIQSDMPINKIKRRLFEFVQSHPEISNVEELAASIRAFGVGVKVRDSKKFGAKYINFSFDVEGKRKAINLKDGVFLDAYLARRNLELAQAPAFYCFSAIKPI
ncbi:hypothetical protein [Rappaport israeli]|uniref:hypothetical protein n=1 Tax=Rappaport israeli TaxID=1839807 RepID=UPI000931FF3C|nr:hypothetical protein [Rappaport israeli]